MLDRQKVETILIRRFPGATREQIAAAANAIMGLDEEWEEVVNHDEELWPHFSAQCTDVCYLAREVDRGREFRVLRRRTA